MAGHWSFQGPNFGYAWVVTFEGARCLAATAHTSCLVLKLHQLAVACHTVVAINSDQWPLVAINYRALLALVFKQ